ncbi:MAG: hypothetical protein IH991_20185, partial [Planctomycetes bacterium]|nr:hypothetical protein [Planctomycetota bacterium]
MSSILDKATDQLSENVEQRSQHEFYHFEPWDIEARPKWLIDLAAEYDVELEVEGNDYQIGRLMERSKHICCTIASNQTGKSLLDLIQAIIMLTGELPYSMCYDKGVDTGVARLVTAENLSRFGNDGKGGCGNIIGVGKYPTEKIAKGRGNAVWICCWKKNRDEFWVPRLTKLIPDELLDKTRGVDGYGSAKNEFYLHGDNRIVFITYEQGFSYVRKMRMWTPVITFLAN